MPDSASDSATSVATGVEVSSFSVSSLGSSFSGTDFLEDFFAFFLFFLEAASSTNSINAISDASPKRGKANL